MSACSLNILKAGFCYHPAAMARRGAGLCAVEFPALAGLILHPSEGAILFDTGYDQAFFTATDPMPERLYRWTTPVKLKPGHAAADQISAFGLKPHDVRHIFISHFHGDHVAGLHAFPRAQLFCSRSGADQLASFSRFGRVRRGLLASLTPADLPARARFLEDMTAVPLGSDFQPFASGVDLFGDGRLLAVNLPGHCIGHWGLLVRTDTGWKFLVGDAAWSSSAVRDNVPPPRLTTALLGHTQTYRNTLSALHTLQQRNGEILIAPSHCPEIAALAAPAP